MELSGARRAPFSGTLGGRPLAVLLAQASERRTTGVLTLACGARYATIVFDGGRIANVTSNEPPVYLGAILYENGIIDAATLDRTLGEVARTKRLHGQILVEARAVTQAEVDDALAEQTHRRIHPLFAWPEETQFALRDGLDAPIINARDADRPTVDAWRALWRGTRAHPPAHHIGRSLDRIAGDVQIANLGVVLRFGLADDELTFCERLTNRPAPFDTLVHTSPLGIARTRALLWCIALAKALSATATRPLGPSELGVDGIRRRAQQIASEDAWTALGLPPGAAPEVARAAYFRLARQWQPERLPTPLKVARAECREVFVKLAEAQQAILEVETSRALTRPAPALTLREADEALAAGDLARAEEIARMLSSGGMRGPEARALVAWCEAAAGSDVASAEQVTRALSSLDRVLAGDPDCGRALLYRGKLHVRAGRADHALRDFRRVGRGDAFYSEAARNIALLEARHADDAPSSSHTSGLRRLLATVASRR